jgi:sigma-B regulation protein RsbU (phosphoserine phosphatase)
MLLLAALAPAILAQIAGSPAPQGFFDASRLQQTQSLDSPWRMHAGDDPAWARPDFDDSAWALFNPHNDIKPLMGNARPSVVWYRQRVKVSPDQAGLALREVNLASAFEIYVNGQRLIASGQIYPYIPRTFAANVVARIPDSELATGTVLIAMRVHISPSEWSTQGPGYSAGNLAIGQQSTLYAEDWLMIIGANALDWLDHVTLIALGVVAIILFSTQRRQTPYLWIAAGGLANLLLLPEPLVTVFHNVPLHWAVLNVLGRVVTPFLFVSLYFSFVGIRVGWRWRAFLVFAGILNAYSGLQGLVFPVAIRWQFLVNLPFIVLLAVVMPAILAVHMRRGNREAGILLIPVLLFSLYVYAEVGLGILFQFPAWRDFALLWGNRIDRYPAGPFTLSLNTFSGIFSTLSLALIMLLRSIRVSRRQAQLEGELAAAQQVQQVLLPEEIAVVPGFITESVYQPAQQVGGDFFQILPAGDGGLLVVVGDVAGKGLPAAMLVSVLVGAIRAVAEYTRNPAELLANLNERLVGRTQGSFSTALAVHITADGWVTIANAGHLSPYLDGKEVALHAALPLGVLTGAIYETSQFYLAHASRLTFYSDGVVEAQNARGELFGFDRAQEISIQPAAAIVAAAQHFGQEDDITVVTIARDDAMATAA